MQHAHLLSALTVKHRAHVVARVQQLTPPLRPPPSLAPSLAPCRQVGEILEGSRQALAGIDILRKVCNHPDLLERLSGQDAPDYGAPGVGCVRVRV